MSTRFNDSMLGKQSLELLFKSPVTNDMIQFLTDETLRVFPSSKTEDFKAGYPSPPHSPVEATPKSNTDKLPSLMTFMTKLVRYTNVYTATLLTSVVYLNKLKALLPPDVTCIPSTAHRVFLACLILSAKFHNDSSPMNKHWTKYTDGLFTVEDVNLMERQLLKLFNWDIRIRYKDLQENLYCLLEPIKQDLIRSCKLEQYRTNNTPYPSPVSSCGPLKLPISYSIKSRDLSRYATSKHESAAVKGTISSSSSSSTLVNSASHNTLLPSYLSCSTLNHSASMRTLQIPEKGYEHHLQTEYF
ncbi:HDL413Wp [Eremothecium sinecaudum]|uniref:HDL413Wp n=1 Tax=Eremothecium sinecaudum TaxID=45286 RepID=A0A0X8HRX8_9SACH|nr:HDL413Wp [Eremothecium sinecaudum]AMD20331.1 HDL413Wp [Eremothecium sinecaudum]